MWWEGGKELEVKGQSEWQKQRIERCGEEGGIILSGRAGFLYLFWCAF